MKDIVCSVMRPVTVEDASIHPLKLIGMGVGPVNASTVARYQKDLDVSTAHTRITKYR